jgi:hypothetical protein
VKDAKRIAFGSIPAPSLEEYYAAWQHLYDAKADLKQADIDYLDKLICDGCVKPEEGYFDILDK